MAPQAEVQRDRRAHIINAQGEFQAAEKLVAAAEMISKQPVALQLRFLQTIQDFSSAGNGHTILPLPIDLFGPFESRALGASEKQVLLNSNVT